MNPRTEHIEIYGSDPLLSQARGTKSFISVLINESPFSSCSQVKILFAIDSIVTSCVQLLLPDVSITIITIWLAYRQHGHFPFL